jgi:hypothetical protein
MPEGSLPILIVGVAEVPSNVACDVLRICISIVYQMTEGILKSIARVPTIVVIWCIMALAFWLARYDAAFEGARRQAIKDLGGHKPFIGCIGSNPMTYPRNFLEDLVDQEYVRQSKMTWWEYQNAPSPRNVVIGEIRKRTAGSRRDVLDDYLEEEAVKFQKRPWWRKTFAGYEECW